MSNVIVVYSLIFTAFAKKEYNPVICDMLCFLLLTCGTGCNSRNEILK